MTKVNLLIALTLFARKSDRTLDNINKRRTEITKAKILPVLSVDAKLNVLALCSQRPPPVTS